MQNNLQPKEELIIEEIINKNYNPRMFFKFLKHNKDNGDDLESWKFKELQTIIEIYKRMVNGEIDENQITLNFLQKELEWNEELTQRERESRITKAFCLVDPQEYRNTQNFQIQLENQIEINQYFLESDFEVTVQDVKEESVFFIFKRTLFEVETVNKKWKAMRTFEDFVLLKNSLQLTFPLMNIPDSDYNSLKKMGYFWGKDKTQSQLLYLNYFLKTILNNVYLKNSQQLLLFLSADRETFLKSIKKIDQNPKEYKKNLENFQSYFFSLKQPEFFKNIIKNLPSFKKEIVIENSHMLNEFNNGVKSKLEQICKMEEGFLHNSRVVGKLLTELQEKMQQFSQQAGMIYKKICEFKIYELPYIDYISNSFCFAQKNLESFAKNLNLQSDFFESEFFGYLSYVNEEKKGLIKNINQAEGWKKKLTILKSKFQASDCKQEFVDDINIFKAYLNQRTHFNFKQLFMLQNKILNTKLKNYIDSYVVSKQQDMDDTYDNQVLIQNFFDQIPSQNEVREKVITESLRDALPSEMILQEEEDQKKEENFEENEDSQNKDQIDKNQIN